MKFVVDCCIPTEPGITRQFVNAADGNQGVVFVIKKLVDRCPYLMSSVVSASILKKISAGVPIGLDCCMNIYNADSSTNERDDNDSLWNDKYSNEHPTACNNANSNNELVVQSP